MRKCVHPNQIYAFSASKLEKAIELKNELGYIDAKAYGSYEEMFADENVGTIFYKRFFTKTYI